MPDSRIQVEYNQQLDGLVDVFSRVRRPGDFYATGSLTAPMPRLEIAGVGTVSFPVPASQAQEIIRQAEQAPYGRGEETIVDTKVRKVWQIMPSKVCLGGATWTQTFEGILSRVVEGLGCQKAAVSAELYKLLVYDAGGFFVAHRDTEKTKGMFGTLVVVLPSLHSGGELVVRHAGREAVLDLCPRDVALLSYAAFYADCEHEVRPIKEGYRVCLVYNLVQRTRGKGSAKPLAAPDYRGEVKAVSEMLSAWADDPDSPPKLVYLLEHQYSPEGLSFSGLKNADAAIGKVLAEAARQTGFAVHAGIVHIEESGSAELLEESYGRSKWGRYNEDEEKEESGSEEFEVIDVCDAKQYISQWVNLEDQPVHFGEVPLGEGELLPQGALDDEVPDQQRVSEATGNEGASFERSYHRAAIVLWREEKYAEVLLQGGVSAALPYLKDCIRRWSTHASSSGAAALRKQALHVARLIIEAWKNVPTGYRSYSGSANAPDRAAMIQLLLRLNDMELLQQFIQDVVVPQYDGSENQALAKASRCLGPEKTGELFSAVVEKNMPVFHVACVDLLARTCGGQARKPASEDLSAQIKIAASAVHGLSRINREGGGYGSPEWCRRQQAKPLDAAMVARLVETLQCLEAVDLAEKAAAILCAHPDIFAPDTVILPALRLLDKEQAHSVAANRSLVQLWAHAAEFLLTRSELPPVPPADWAQSVKIDCACAHCRELQAFSANPIEKVHRFRLRKELRQHLHGIIDRYRLDMTHETERVGSPQTLVCTKTRRAYQARCKQYDRDVEAFRSLAALLPGSVPHQLGPLLKRVSDSIGRA